MAKSVWTSRLTFAFVAAVAAMTAETGNAQDDAVERGEQLYAWCSTCHSVVPGEAGLQGPNLFGIVDSQAATQVDFPYSEAMISLGEQGLIWDANSLNAFLADPLVFAPNNTMGFFGIADPADRADLIAYLTALSEDR